MITCSRINRHLSHGRLWDPELSSICFVLSLQHNYLGYQPPAVRHWYDYPYSHRHSKPGANEQARKHISNPHYWWLERLFQFNYLFPWVRFTPAWETTKTPICWILAFLPPNNHRKIRSRITLFSHFSQFFSVGIICTLCCGSIAHYYFAVSTFRLCRHLLHYHKQFSILTTFLGLSSQCLCYSKKYTDKISFKFTACCQN